MLYLVQFAMLYSLHGASKIHLSIREYYGYLMTEHWNNNRSQYTCIDSTFKSVAGTSTDIRMVYAFSQWREDVDH